MSGVETAALEQLVGGPGGVAGHRAFTRSATRVPFDSVRFRLLPTDDRFFALFNDAAHNVAECARRLRELLDGAEDGLAAVVACERHGDELLRQILTRLNTSFVTPFDREDIHGLAEELDDVVDD